MGKRKPYEKKSFESMGNRSDISANIYESMMLSKPYNELTPRQKVLYQYCKLQLYGERQKPITDNSASFTMNKWKWQNKYQLYKKGSEGYFYKDRDALIEKGFIDCLYGGADARTKSIYQLSNRWTKYDTSEYTIPNQYKTLSMTGTRKKDYKKR